MQPRRGRQTRLYQEWGGVGESSRSVQERALEHWSAASKKDERSHMVKHQSMEHAEEPPQFIFKVISMHRTALNRQIKEAVRIRRRGGAASILNSKSEYNRCHIPRLVVEKEDEEVKKLRKELQNQDKEERSRQLEEEDNCWRAKKTRELEIQKVKRRRPSETDDDRRAW